MIGGEEDEGKTIIRISAVYIGAGIMQQKAWGSGDDDRDANDRSGNNRDRDDGARSAGVVFWTVAFSV